MSQKVLVKLLLLCCILCMPALAMGRKQPKKLTIYVHESLAPPFPTVIPVATASGNLTDVGFGTIEVFSLVITSGPSLNDTTIGIEPGFVIFGTQNVFVRFTFTLTLPEGNGTLAVQGQLDLDVFPREYAVVGGTGIFRYANGYDINEFVDGSNPADYVTVHNIFLKFL